MRRVRRPLRRALVVLAVCCAAMAAWSAAAGRPVAALGRRGPTRRALLARGRVLFAQGCASCHGEDLRGRPRLGPSLRGAGAAAADFYLSTGRMPLADPTDEPVRTQPAYPRADIDALVAFVGSFGGPAHPARRPRARKPRRRDGEVHRALRRLPPDRRARRASSPAPPSPPSTARRRPSSPRPSASGPT